MSEIIKVWHFTDGKKLRDGQALRVGKVYRVDPPIIPCERGLHGSVRAIDALRYAPGSQVSLCELRGEIVAHDGDKHAASERKVLWTLDATRVLWLFACWVAEDALKAERKAGREPHPDSWAAPKARRAWLDGKITDEQLSAAGRAAGRAPDSAAYSAADRAADSAAYSAADRAADRAAYRAADRAADSAAYRAAHSAAGIVAYSAAYSAAYRAARDRQNRKLETMILAAHARETR